MWLNRLILSRSPSIVSFMAMTSPMCQFLPPWNGFRRRMEHMQTTRRDLREAKPGRRISAINLCVRGGQIPSESPAKIPLVKLLFIHPDVFYGIDQAQDRRDSCPAEQGIRYSLASLIQVKLVDTESAEDEGQTYRDRSALHRPVIRRHLGAASGRLNGGPWRSPSSAVGTESSGRPSVPDRCATAQAIPADPLSTVATFLRRGSDLRFTEGT